MKHYVITWVNIHTGSIYNTRVRHSSLPTQVEAHTLITSRRPGLEASAVQVLSTKEGS